MAFYIKVIPEYQSNVTLLQKSYSDKAQWNTDLQLCYSKPRIGCFKAMFIPVRTDSLKNLCKDMFLPSFIYVALKSNGLASKIFLGIITLALDIITLPIRLVTVIPRAIYNAAHPKQAYPFYQYLINNGVAPNDLNVGHVYVEVIKIDAINNKYNLSSEGTTLNFMELPETISPTVRVPSHQQWGLTEDEMLKIGYPQFSNKTKIEEV
jgi:hypothetical protein